MAVIDIEGFDHIAIGQMVNKGWSGNLQSMTTGRLGGQAARLSSFGVSTFKPLPSNYSTVYCGFAFSLSARYNGVDFFAFRDTAGALACRVSLDANNHVQVRNSGGTVIATGTTVISTSTWYYLEVKVVINGASGSAKVQLNGGAEIAATTGNFGTTNIGSIYFAGYGAGQSGSWDFDDIYVADSSGGQAFLGDVRVDTQWPSSDGTYSQWTPSTGSNHAALVDETTPNSDTDYNSSATAGQIDSFNMGALATTSGSVIAVAVRHWARKDDAGTRQVQTFVRQSSTDYTPGATFTLSTTYTSYGDLLLTQPAGGGWTIAAVNAAQFGVKVVA